MDRGEATVFEVNEEIPTPGFELSVLRLDLRYEPTASYPGLLQPHYYLLCGWNHPDGRFFLTWFRFVSTVEVRWGPRPVQQGPSDLH
jgi:hypothetical protein